MRRSLQRASARVCSGAGEKKTGFRGLGFRGLGFRRLGFRGLGFTGSGIRREKSEGWFGVLYGSYCPRVSVRVSTKVTIGVGGFRFPSAGLGLQLFGVLVVRV